MFNFFIERPVFSTVIALIMILVGGLSILGLPIAQYPQVVPPQVTVSTSFPGANADVVAQSVAAPIEQQVNGSQDMLYMGSKSGNDGSYTLTVTFDIGTDKNIDAVEVQNRVAIAQSQLPSDVIRSGITVRKTSTDFLEAIALTSPEGRYDGIFLSNYALLNLYDALGRVRGVGQVRIFGARDYSMRIWLDPERMARLGVTATDIANVIREQNQIAPAGSIGQPPVPPGQQMQYTVFVKGRLVEVSEFENIVIREAGNGQVVRLKDVARVELAAADYSISGANDDIPAALIGIFLQPDANALDVAKQVKQVMDDQAPHFPPGMVYSIPYSTTPFVTESLKEVVKTLLIAFGLVVFVVFLFLQSWRATLIPILVVPISLIGTFGAFAALGFSINTLTLFGLVLAIGIVVDDAIVVVEAVQQRLDAGGMTPMEATKSAIADVGGPVIAIALVLAAVFVPVAFLGGLTGQLYKQFALTLAVSVVLSAVCALTFTPAMCALLLKPVDEARPRQGPLSWFFTRFNGLFERSRNGYIRSVSLMERHAILVMLTFGVLLLAVWGLISHSPDGPRAAGGPRLPDRAGEPPASSIAGAHQRRPVGGYPHLPRGPGHRRRGLYQRVQFIDRSVGFLQWNRLHAAQAVGPTQGAFPVCGRLGGHINGTTQRANQGCPSARPQPAAYPRAEHRRGLHVRAAESRRRGHRATVTGIAEPPGRSPEASRNRVRV